MIVVTALFIYSFFPTIAPSDWSKLRTACYTKRQSLRTESNLQRTCTVLASQSPQLSGNASKYRHKCSPSLVAIEICFKTIGNLSGSNCCGNPGRQLAPSSLNVMRIHGRVIGKCFSKLLLHSPFVHSQKLLARTVGILHW